MAKEKPNDSGVEEPIAPVQLTEEQLKAELQTALDSGDFKAVAQVSRKIDTMQRAAEKAELDAKRQALEGMSDVVKNAIQAVITPMYDSGELDAADGVWLSWDFGEQAPTVRLMKTATRAPRSGGGGTGKKFDISTTALLEKHGGELYKDSGMDFKTAYDSNTDKNWRYAIRNALLKLDGII